MTTVYSQDPDARLPYEVDWSSFLTSVDDTADTAVWVAPDGITVEDSGLTAGVHVGVVSGGTVGNSYAIVSRLTTVGGLVQEQAFVVAIVSS